MARTQLLHVEGDRDRSACLDCGHVFYENPKIITGSVVVEQGQGLLCRRASAPRIGCWTLPAGYLELDETVAEGAIREAAEEACAAIEIEGVLAILSISRIGQVQIIHRARFAGAPDFAPGRESLEVALFPQDGIPWDELAFPSVAWALQGWIARGDAPLGAPFGNPASDPRGTIAPELDHSAGPEHASALDHSSRPDLSSETHDIHERGCPELSRSPA